MTCGRIEKIPGLAGPVAAGPFVVATLFADVGFFDKTGGRIGADATRDFTWGAAVVGVAFFCDDDMDDFADEACEDGAAVFCEAVKRVALRPVSILLFT